MGGGQGRGEGRAEEEMAREGRGGEGREWEWRRREGRAGSLGRAEAKTCKDQWGPESPKRPGQSSETAPWRTAVCSGACRPCSRAQASLENAKGRPTGQSTESPLQGASEGVTFSFPAQQWVKAIKLLFPKPCHIYKPTWPPPPHRWGMRTTGEEKDVQCLA